MTMKRNLTAWQSIAMKSSSLALLLLVGGCVTCGHIVEDFTREPRSRDSLIYSGTKYHLHEIPLYRTRNRMHWASQLSYSLRWWHYIDLPLCVCADTLLLPYTVPRTSYSHWRAQPTREEIAIRPHIEEFCTCMCNLRGLEAGKLLHVHQHGLGPTESVPQDLDVYRAQMNHPWNQGPFYVCPADGAYVVGGQTEEPACSVHGTASQEHSGSVSCKSSIFAFIGLYSRFDINLTRTGSQPAVTIETAIH